MSLGEPWEASGMARAGARIAHEAHGRCWAAHDSGPFGRSRSTLVQLNGPRVNKGTDLSWVVLWRLGLGREPSQGGSQAPLSLIQNTC